MYRVRGAIHCARRVHSIFFVRGIGNELPSDAINLVPTKTVESTLVDYYIRYFLKNLLLKGVGLRPSSRNRETLAVSLHVH